MIVYSIVAITLLFALLSFVIAGRAATYPLRKSWALVALALSLAVFVFLYGVWVFLTVYLKYVYAVVFAAFFIVRLSRKRGALQNGPSKAWTLMSLFFTLLFATLSVLYFVGTTGTPYGIARLDLPFRSGSYFVFQGGKGLPTNLFHYKLRTAIYAMDIVKLNSMGNRANRIFSRRLEDYEIYGDTVYSPCNGRVKATRNSMPDNVPPHISRDGSSLNMVLIETDSMYVFLGHLKKGSVMVHEGDMVTTGQPLGCVGNSGFTLEPHLHIQAHAKTDTTKPWYREKPLLIEFYGKSYLLFDVIKASE